MSNRYLQSLQSDLTRHIERAVFDLRRGLPVVIDLPPARYLVAPIEGLTDALLDDMRADHHGVPYLILTPHRLDYLGQPQDLALGIPAGCSATELMHWAAGPVDMPPEPDRPTDARSFTQADHAAIRLLHRGLLIPAAVIIELDDDMNQTVQHHLDQGDLLSIAAPEVMSRHPSTGVRLHETSAAEVPLEAAAHARFHIFREDGTRREHVAVLIGQPRDWPDPVPVRMHSSCLTGDLFGSLRCDCGSQLKTSVATLNERGGGVLLYLAQEGRGIGLANKMRAYQLQDNGLDTVEADRVLGFDKDERDYSVAREMLTQLDITRIDLLTNNPNKCHALEQAPITVSARSSLYGRVTPQNRRYLTTKAERAGHWLTTLLGQPADSDTDESSCNH